MNKISKTNLFAREVKYSMKQGGCYMKFKDGQLDIVVNNEIVHVDPEKQEVTQVDSKESSLWKKAFRGHKLMHRSKD